MRNFTFLNLRLATDFSAESLLIARKSQFLKFSVILFCIIFSMGKSGMAQPGPEWEVYRTINLSRPTPMDDFQVRVVLSAGEYDHIKPDGSDIRFYEGTTNIQCSYWIEKWQITGQSVIWVKVPNTNITSLTMYYGNPAATAVSDGNATFDFFDDFTSLNSSVWSYAGVTQSGSEISIAAAGFISNTSAFNPPSSTFFMEAKHKETYYKRIRYYATSIAGNASTQGSSGILGSALSNFDYGYFSDVSPFLTGNTYWSATTNHKVYVNTNYITQWEIKDDVIPGTMKWSTINYDTNYNLISSFNTSINGTLRHITIATDRTTMVDWIRLRKSDGNPEVNGTPGVVVVRNPLVITNVTSSWCQNDSIIITGSGFKSALTDGTPDIKVGEKPVQFVSINSDGTRIKGLLTMAPATGKVVVKIAVGADSTTNIYTIHELPTVNAGLPLAAICQGQTSAPLGGQIGGGATDAQWTADVTGGTFSGTTFQDMTWTPPAGFTGTVTFTLTASGSPCSGSPATKTMEVKGVTAQPMTWPDLTICQDTSVMINAPTGDSFYVFRVNGNPFHSGNLPFGSTPKNIKTGDILSVVVTQFNGCTITYTSNPMQVRPKPSGRFETSDMSGVKTNDSTICIGDDINFLYDPNVGENISKYFYKLILINDGSTIYSDSANFFTTSSLANGSQVKLIVDNQGCEKVFDPIPVTVHNRPVASLTTNPDPAIECVGEPITFTATGGTDYQFWVNGGLMQDWNNQIYSSTTLANGDAVHVIVRDVNWCKDTSSSIPVTIHPLPTKPVVTNVGSLTFCNDNAGVSPVLQAPSASSYQWFKNGSAIPGATGQTYNVPKDATAGGQYAVQVTNANGCISSASNPVTVVVNPAAPKPSISLGGATTFCDGESVTLSSPLSDLYQWFKDDSPITGATGRDYTVTTSGNYSVSVVNTNGCGSITPSDPVQVTVNPLPTTPVISATDNKIRFCDEDHTVLNADVIGSSYQWYHDEELIPGATGQSFTTLSTPLAAGNYTVRVKDNKGCVSAASSPQNIIVDPLPEPSLISDDLLICRNTTGYYETESGNGIHDYIWDIQGGTIIAGGSTSDNFVNVHWNDDDDPKSVDIRYRNSFGCQNKKFQPIQTGTNPLPTIATTPANVVDVCINYPGNVYTTESGNTNYEWSVTGGTITSGGGVNDNTATVTWTTAGPHTIKVNYKNSSGCAAAAPTSYNVTVNPLPVASFSYGASPYCSDAANPMPTMSTDPNAKKGIFSSTSGLVFVSNTTGQINLAASTPGTYTVTNTIAAAKGCNVVTETATVTITEKPAASISYENTPFCTSDASANTVKWSSDAKGAYQGGTFSAPAGLTIDASTGAITPSTSTVGNYTVTYAIPASGGCGAATITTDVKVTQMPAPTIFYASSSFCVSDGGTKYPTLDGSGVVTGGSYSAPSGLSLNNSNGAIVPSSSTPGTYTVTYTIEALNGCGPVSTIFNVTITGVPTASISYTNSPFCSSETSVSVSLTGTNEYQGGTFSSTPGLNINASTGLINPSLSTAGTYTVTYTTQALGGCSAVTDTTTVGITAKPEVNAGANVETCADANTITISSGYSASNHNGLTWTSSGDGTFSTLPPPAPPAVSYKLGANDKLNGGVVTLTLTAAGKDNCANVSATKTLTIKPLPDAVVILPTSTEFCEGTIQPLSSVKSAVTDYNPVFTALATPVAIPENNFTGVSRDIPVSGIPANAVIKEIIVTLNITHPHDKDLVANLRSPSGKEINLFSNVGGTGANFTNTRFSSKAIRPIQTFGTAPFNDEFSPQFVLGAMGAAFATSFSGLYTTATSMNGNWKIKISDMTAGNVGTLQNCTITIYYSVPIDPVPVTWSPVAGLYSDPAAETPYAGEPLTTVYTKVATAGTNQYTATTQNNVQGCRNSTNVNVVVRQAPSVYIASDYCSEPDKVKLTAMASGAGPFTYNWNTGSNSDFVWVDEAHDYYASVTNSYGCVGTAVMSVAKELVVNGDFEAGYIPGSFNTDYIYRVSPDSLYSEGRFAIDTNAHNYHKNFFGKDHTTPAQTGKFMIINGYAGASNKVIWEQTVAVEPHTRYYYSAWAMNLNNAGPIFASLQFEVNGVPIGTIADLSTVTKPTKESDVNVNNWIRFYYGGTNGWYSDDTTIAKIRIINLEENALGNDFGLDDISFATLSPFLRGPEDGSDDQAVCSDSEIQTITYQVGTGLTKPDIHGLPPGLTTTYTDGLNFRISGTPINNTNSPITYNYTVSTKSCTGAASAKSLPGKIVVYPNSKTELTSAPSTLDQTVCMDVPVTAVSYSAGGGISGVGATGLPAGVTANLNNGVITIAGIPTVSGTFNYTVNPQLATGNSCPAEPITGVMKISPKSKAGEVNSVTVCLGDNGTITLNDDDQVGDVVTWQISHDGISFTDIPGSANALSQSFTNVTQSTAYRVMVKNEYCPDMDSSAPARIRINNLWEGSINDQWNNLTNWSSGIIPTAAMLNCLRTVTIPAVPSGRHEPVITLAGFNSANVYNLHIQNGGHLTVNGGNLQIAGIITKDNGGILDARHGGIEYNGTTTQTIQSGIFKDNAINNFTVSNSSTGGVVLAAPIDIYRSLTFTAGDRKLSTGGNLTLKSTPEETAWVGKMTTSHDIVGAVTVERYINSGTNQTSTSHRKSWQLLAVPTTGQSIRESWMEGASASNISSPAPGSAGNPNPGYGTMMTSNVPNAGNFPKPGFDVYTAPGPSIKVFNSATGQYDGPDSTGVKVYDPRGWMVLVRGDRSVYQYNQAATPTVLRTKGKLFTPKNTPASISVGQNTFASVGNPYASAIDLNEVTFTGNIGNSITVWDPRITGEYGLGGFVTLVKGSGGTYIPIPSTPAYPSSAKNNIIQSGQAFFVQTAPGQTGTVSFAEKAKTEGSSVMAFRTGSVQQEWNSQLRTNLYGVNNGQTFIVDGTLHLYSPTYSNAIDGLDARKMSNTSENLSILSQGKELVAERRNSILETDTIHFKLTGVVIQPYRFEFISEGLSKFGQQPYLEDKYKNTQTPLEIEGTTYYDFNIDNNTGSRAADRFKIVFKEAAAPLATNFVDVNAVQKKSDIVVSWLVENEVGERMYEVEKSTDGNFFKKVSTVDAKNEGTSAGYSWTDENAGSGNHYYRIKKVSENNRINLSKVVKVSIQDIKATIVVRPNPIVGGVIQLHFTNQPVGKYRLRLMNPGGQVMISKNITRTELNSVEKLSWDYTMAHGIYSLEITKPDGSVQIIKVMY